MQTIAEWLLAWGFERYTQLFHEHDIDLEVVPSLSEPDLASLGISLGHRKKLLNAIAELSAESAVAPISAESSERRQLTVLFCDMVGFTELASRVDPEILQQIIRAYEDACAVCITRYEGYVFQRLGDGIVAFFGYLCAHESEGERAIHAALAIVDSLARLEIVNAGRVQVRIGIATGVVVVSSLEKSAAGETMNLAARLQAIAQPGSIVVSEPVQRLAGGAFLYHALGSHQLKGIAQPTTVYQIVGVSALASRFEAATGDGLTTLVGRESDLALLSERWKLAQSGTGQVVLLAGEPGIGKSRLMSALGERVIALGASTLRFQCSPYYTHSAFYPSIDNFERALKFTRDEAPESKLDRLETLIVTRFGRPLADVRFIAAMLSMPHERYGSLSMSPQRFKQETLRVLADLVDAASRLQPTVMLFEDAHWADPTSLEMLDLIIDRLTAMPLLIVITHRPEFQSRWAESAHVSTLNITRLDRDQSAAMVNALVSNKALPGDLLEQILIKTDGVPLFVEELTKSMIQSDDLKVVGDHYEFTGATRSLNLPTNLRDSLMARLDRHPSSKEVAQIGAVIGRTFSYELIQAVAPHSQHELENALRQLVDSGLAFRRGTPPEATYTFKHALVQDTAYDSLLKSRRRDLHGKIAGVIETRFPRLQETEPEILASHYSAAGQADPAIAYWLKAARRATTRSAFREALAQLDQAEVLLNDQPPGPQRTQRALQLQVQRAAVLLVTKGMSNLETGAAYDRARELCDQLGDDVEEIFPALYGNYIFHLVRGDAVQSADAAQAAWRRAQQVKTPALLLLGRRVMGPSLVQRGELHSAADHLEHALQLYDPVRDRESALIYGADLKSACLSWQAQVTILLGAPDRALTLAAAAVDHAESLPHLHSVAFALSWLSTVHFLRREPTRAFEHAQRELALSQRHEFGMWLAYSKADSGAALIEGGNTEDGLNWMKEYFASTNVTGHSFNRPLHLSAVASGAAQRHKWGEAAEYLTAALHQVETSGERWYEAELYRLKGEFMLAEHSMAAAEQAILCFDQSLAVARVQGAKLWELRTSMSLGKLWLKQGRRSEARDLLAPAYAAFVEGFDTQDLKEAKFLLDSL